VIDFTKATIHPSVGRQTLCNLYFAEDQGGQTLNQLTSQATSKITRNDPIAVEPPVTRRPPHRSLRAGLPHKAPASGRNVQAMVLAVSVAPHVATVSGTGSGGWFGAPHCPWPDPFSPPTPPQDIAAPPCSPVSSILWVCLTSRDRSSLSCTLGFHSADPPNISSGPILRSPGFRVRSVPTCLGSSTAREPETPRLGGVPDVAFPLPLVGRPPER